MAQIMLASPSLLPRTQVLGKRQRKQPSTTYTPPADSENDTDLPSPKPTKKAAATPREKKFLCPHEGCDKRYARPSRLDEHIRSTHTKERAFPCEYDDCDKAFFRKSHLEHHVRQTHTKDFKYQCDTEGCKASFVTNQRLKVHKESHTKQLTCPYPECGMPFRKKNVLQRHISKEHKGEQNKFCCSQVHSATGAQCTESFKTSAQLRRHEADAHDVMQYWCSACVDSEDAPAGFKTYTDLQRHNRNVHPPTCETCGTSFASAHLLDAHFAVHHSGLTPDQRASHQCPVKGCQKLFTRASNLKTHVRTVHDNDRSFVCGQFDTESSKGLGGWDRSNACYQGFGHKAALEKHIRSFHFDNGRMIYPGARAVSAKALPKRKGAQHMSLITKLTGDGYEAESGREIACVIHGCPFKFAREYDLEQHLQSEHWLDEEEVAEALVEHEALSGGKFWVGGLDEGQASQAFADGDQYHASGSSKGTEDFWRAAPHFGA